VLSTVPRTTCQIVALLLICVAAYAAIACQVHLTSSDHEHAVPSNSHSSSAAHASLDFSCLGLTAVLPTAVLFAAFIFQMLPVTPLMRKYAVLAFPPFIPPRYLTRQVLVA
jgi:hypothetical protein